MKQIVFAFISIGFFSLCYSQKKAASAQSGIAVKAEVDVHTWIEKNFSKGKVPPFSFVLGGKESKSFITQWEYNAEVKKTDDPNIENFVYTYKDKQTGFTVKCLVTGFKNFHAVEWVLKFSNGSNQNTEAIENQKVVDYSLTSDEAGKFVLHHARGSNAQRNDFEARGDLLKTGKSFYMTPVGGRPSDDTGFPFFNIETPSKRGIMVAIGWTGKWFADVRKTDEKTVLLNSGMERMKLVLYPNEEIRTPRICMLFWSGEDRMVGHNKFRQFILAYHTRKINGKNAELPLAFGLGFGGPPPCNEYSCATELYSKAMVRRHQQFNLLPDVFWIDAGWYKGCGTWWEHVGNWTINKDNFPNGFKPVTDEIHNAGAKFILWFEPERVYKNTDVYREHPEFIITLKDTAGLDEPYKNTSLFDLGNKTALNWMTNRIVEMIKKEGIDHYRQDFNMDPWKYWIAKDTPDRIGMSEIRHIEGLYAFWDSLLIKFPNLIIDNCASGGRRLDLETVSRSSPLWRTDYNYGEPNGYQAHSYGLNFYLPLHGTGNFVATPYNFRSALSSALVMQMDITTNWPALQKNFQEYRRLRPYYYGDYYPLSNHYNIAWPDNVWMAYQMHRPEENDGIILAFRRPDCNEDVYHIKPKGLDEKANYELFYEDFHIKAIKTGAEIMKGIDISSPVKPGSLLISYKKI